jgi:hypothetical protein
LSGEAERIGAMTASAQVAIYRPPSASAWLRRRGGAAGIARSWVRAGDGPVTTYVIGDDADLFAALQDASARAFKPGHVVITGVVADACPIPD